MDLQKFVDSSRLREDIKTVGGFGAHSGDGTGRTAPTASEPNGKAREYVLSQLKNAGMETRIDAVGNFTGRWVPEGADPNAPPVAAGSHLDSVQRGGIFDGVLGVCAALESVRALQAAGVGLTQPVEVVNFTGEEGVRFTDGLLGSSVATGKYSVETALQFEDADGTTLASALSNIGFDGEGNIDASDWDAWLEVHIEQDRRLADAGCPVGIVTDITGNVRCKIEIDGTADHAGTTAMHERTDALVAASELVLAVEKTAKDIANETSKTAVATVGSIDVTPNEVNVVPGHAALQLDIRDIARRPMERLITKIQYELGRLENERGVTSSLSRSYDLDPVNLDARCTTALTEGAEQAGIDWMNLHSGAGHDTMRVADVTDAGMAFVRSRNEGASHSPREWTDWSDCTAAAETLAESIRTLAS